MAATRNIPSIRTGDTWLGMHLRLLLNALPVNLAGARVRMQLRRSPADGEVAAEWDSESGTIIITDAADGQIEMVGRDIELQPATYYYDVEYTLSTGRVLTAMAGKWTITQDVTR